ncbi:MAG: hypothetical protein M9955_20175 [Rhizobiaceae bacterium]|nr:hypothetical protein [Rhizobiaceae bacterium]
MKVKLIEQVAANVSPDMLAAIDKAAAAELISRATWLRRAIWSALEDLGARDGRA